MIVASDLEGTLTTAETWRLIGEYLKASPRGAAYRRTFLLTYPRFILARLNLIDGQDVRSQWMVTLLRFFEGIDETEFNRVCLSVADEMWEKRRQDVVPEFEKHRKDGARIVIASGTFQQIAQGFADRLGAEALGTPVEIVDGKVTGHMPGEVSVKDVKARRVHEHIKGKAIDYAYGDTTSDIPLLELAAHPTAVHPDSTFQKIAVQRGWRIIE